MHVAPAFNGPGVHLNMNTDRVMRQAYPDGVIRYSAGHAVEPMLLVQLSPLHTASSLIFQNVNLADLSGAGGHS